MALKAGYLFLAGGGGVLVWSGLKGKSVSSVFRQLAGGDSPAGAVSANPVASVTPIGGETTQTAAGTSDISYSADQMQTAMEVAEFLVRNGYSDAAAAGIAACIAGESAFNPESQGSGGAGLIGWTPPSSASPDPDIITGNATKDLQTQLTDILAYNQAQGQYLAGLNKQTDPVAAADYYSQHFERPAVTDSDVRANVATQVYDTLINGGTGSNG